MISVRSSSLADTHAIAAVLARQARAGDLFVLSGPMGAGKTAFAKGFGTELGVNEPMQSPTFVLLRSYAGRFPLHHADLYRLDHLQEVLDIGLFELLDDGGVGLVEWGELAEPILPRHYLEVRLAPDPEDDDCRTIGVIEHGAFDREASLQDALSPWRVAS